jgi:hypothetical protein
LEKGHIPIEVLDPNGALLTAAVAVFSHSNVPSVGWISALTPKGPNAKGPDAKAFSANFLRTQGEVRIRFSDGRTVEAVKVQNLTRRRVILRIPETYAEIMQSIAPA